MLFLSVRGFLDYAGPSNPLAIAWLLCCLPPTRNEVGILIYGLFAAQWPRPPMPLSTLQETPRGVPSKTRGQDGFATSFPVGLLHPLQHAGLSRRTVVCRQFGSDQIDQKLAHTTKCPENGSGSRAWASYSKRDLAGANNLSAWRGSRAFDVPLEVEVTSYPIASLEWVRCRHDPQLKCPHRLSEIGASGRAALLRL